MPKLGRAPTVTAFAHAFREELGSAVNGAAGRDGRLSRGEAAKLAASGSVYGDNAVNYLERTGQQSVSVNKLLDRGEAYAFATAAKVAGSNQRISLVEARMLPQDLKADWAELRGLDTVAGPKEAFEIDSALQGKLDELMDDTWVSSWDVAETIEGAGLSDAQRDAAADTIASYVTANPGNANTDSVTAVVQAVRGMLSGHLYAPGDKAKFAAELVALPMGELQSRFGDLQAEVSERATETGAIDSPLFGAYLEGMRMINEAVVSLGLDTMLNLVVSDAAVAWSDESIMDGISRPSLGQDAPGSDWKAVAQATTERELDGLWSGGQYDPVDTDAAVAVTDAVIGDIAKTISDVGMGYGGTDDVPYRSLQIDEMLSELGPRDELRMVKSFTRDGDPTSGRRDVHNFTVVNPASGQHLNFFVYQNSL